MVFSSEARKKHQLTNVTKDNDWSVAINWSKWVHKGFSSFVTGQINPFCRMNVKPQEKSETSNFFPRKKKKTSAVFVWLVSVRNTEETHTHTKSHRHCLENTSSSFGQKWHSITLFTFKHTQVTLKCQLTNRQRTCLLQKNCSGNNGFVFFWVLLRIFCVFRLFTRISLPTFHTRITPAKIKIFLLRPQITLSPTNAHMIPGVRLSRFWQVALVLFLASILQESTFFSHLTSRHPFWAGDVCPWRMTRRQWISFRFNWTKWRSFGSLKYILVMCYGQAPHQKTGCA